MDKYGKALCREHQTLERNINNLGEEKKDYSKEIKEDEEEYIPEKEEIIEEEPEAPQSGGFKSLMKKVAVATGKGIVKGSKAVADTTKKKLQERTWKDKILRRMSSGKIKQLVREKKIKAYFIDKPKTSDYIYLIKNKVSLDDIIAFAKRNKVNIRDILTEIEQVKAKNDIEQMRKEGSDIDEFYLEVVEAIHNFKPFRRYKQELPYQIDLARWLQARFPRTIIEEKRGSTRPDIVIRGIAIEVKGPTNHRDLQTISDKCIRYRQYYKQGMIVVLFDVFVNQFRYKDWLRGMEDNYPDVKVIKK